MTTLVEALTEEFQFWLGDSASITQDDVEKMLAAAQQRSTNAASCVKIRIEGDPKDVTLAASTIKQVLRVTEARVQEPHLKNGAIRRELEVQGQPNVSQNGHLNGRVKQPSPVPPPSSAAARLVRDAVMTLARGLLEFPKDDAARCKFSGPYPQSFKEGMGKLSAHFINQGVIIADAMDYWRILSRPLKDWPGMQADLAMDEALIDHEGRITPLTVSLAKGGEVPY